MLFTKEFPRPLSIRPYLETIEGVVTQFALIRLALKMLPKTKIQAFYDAQLLKRIAENESIIKKCQEQSPDKSEMLEDFKDGMIKFMKKEHRKKHRPTNFRFIREFSEDRLNQSELLLLVAHFESFMKIVHKMFLTAAPAKAFSGPEKPEQRNQLEKEIKLRDIFKDWDNYKPFEKFFDDLIENEARRIDSKKIDERANYFSKKFQVSFASKKEIEDLFAINEKRNIISHSIYSPPVSLEQIKEPPLVDDEMLERARHLFREIPRRCIETGAKLHKDYFLT